MNLIDFLAQFPDLLKIIIDPCLAMIDKGLALYGEPYLIPFFRRISVYSHYSIYIIQKLLFFEIFAKMQESGCFNEFIVESYIQIISHLVIYWRQHP